MTDGLRFAQTVRGEGAVGEQRTVADTTSAMRIQAFLIADVRGYTRFTHERGDEAAAALAAKFARIARETVGEGGGEVIELRGDEALGVFASARDAVLVALTLRDRLEAESVDDPEFPRQIRDRA